jgi:predicted enzyme related to lactoylglutathione lyase
MKKVIGFGGIFFKSSDPVKLREWYKNHLGLPVETWGCMMDLNNPELSKVEGYTVWSPFKEDTKYFEPSDKPFMLNFMVEDLHALLAELKKDGVHVLDKTEESEFGKFGWIMDPEGNKIELWQPPLKEAGKE